jgi:hypothetical protein
MERAHILRRLVPVLLVSASFGCNSERRETVECLASRKAALEATVSGTLPQAEQLYLRTQELCGKASAYHLERLQRALERKRKHEPTATRRGGSEDPVKHFLAFALRVREAGDRSTENTRCAERSDPRFGLCTSRIVQPPDGDYVIDYLKDETRVFRLSLALNIPVTCIDLGEHRDLAKWKKADVVFERCDLSGPGLAGLRGLIEQSPEKTTVSLFSADYPGADGEFALKLQR